MLRVSLGHPQIPWVHEARQSQAAYITLLGGGKAKLHKYTQSFITSPVLVPSSNVHQHAYLGCTLQAGTFKLHLIQLVCILNLG